MSSKFPCSMIQKKNKEILILPLKAPLQPKKRFAVGLFFRNSRKSLFFPSKQIIMKEIAIMTGANKIRTDHRKKTEREKSYGTKNSME